jgi:hypothetical protein
MYEVSINPIIQSKTQQLFVASEISLSTIRYIIIFWFRNKDLRVRKKIYIITTTSACPHIAQAVRDGNHPV